MRKLTVLSAIFLSLSLVAAPAFADRGYNGRHGGYGRGHGDGGWGGLAIFGVLTGAIIASEIINNQRPTYVQPQPVYVQQPPEPPVYLEQPGFQSAAPTPTAGNWYYCQSSAMYYPYTQACPEGWVTVPARP